MSAHAYLTIDIPIFVLFTLLFYTYSDIYKHDPLVHHLLHMHEAVTEFNNAPRFLNNKAQTIKVATPVLKVYIQLLIYSKQSLLSIAQGVYIKNNGENGKRKISYLDQIRYVIKKKRNTTYLKNIVFIECHTNFTKNTV